jgi:DNA repair photolyase
MKPVFGTKEWAASNMNIQIGCENNCKYCYARAMAVREDKIDPKQWCKPVLQDDIIRRSYGKRDGTIMFPTTHDITAFNIDQYIHVLLGLLQSGNRVLIVSKPRTELIDRICTECAAYKDQILFRFTIGSTNDTALKFWEPGAPPFKVRLRALQFAHEREFETSVSIEPYLDDRPEMVIEAVRPYITDAIWVGRANFLIERLKINGEWNELTANEAANIREIQSDDKVKALYERYKNDPKVKWKESIKIIVGIEVPTQAGLDI